MDMQGLKAVAGLVERSREPFDSIVVRPLTPIIGAEIEGIDLAGELTNRQFAEVQRAFVEHHVLVFRDQDITADDHKRFGRRFGKLHVHPLQAMKDGDHERLEVKASANSKFVAGEEWHADVTCDAEPPLGSMLHIHRIPDLGYGGDTLFANMHLAYELLSPTLQKFLEELTAVHDGALPWVQAYGFKPDQTFSKNEHPVVVRHPDTGRKILFVNRGFTSHIVQLSQRESANILEMLFTHVERNPALTCRVRWTPNTLVFWDNRCTQHHALWDYYPLAREGHRVSIVGERPTA